MSNESKAIGTFSAENRRFEPSESFRERARIKTRQDYDRLYRESLDSPDTFWRRETADLVFKKSWTEVTSGKLPHVKWFVGAELNVSESCLDRHLETKTRDKKAIIWEGEPGEVRTLTYAELHAEVVRFSAVLRGLGVEKGDRVAIYMGMVPEVAIVMLACARVGAPHSVVFGGFAAESLRDRINDCTAKVVVTQDGAWRRGGVVPLKETVDRAVEGTPSVEKVVMLTHLGPEHVKVEMKAGRDVDYHAAMKSADPKQGQAEIVDAEHPLFILYTSGSTGKPKGVLHTSAGYLAGTHVTSKYVFDLRDEDVYWCTADVGWVTGHSYIVYGPLSNGATCLMYEGAPNFPDWGRFWQIIDKHKVSILYTAPTAIRAFIRAGTDWVKKADLTSLRLLGTVGEPINPEAWIWYHENVGKERCPIVDTWWQTETGAIMMMTLPGAAFAKPGSTGLPFFGVKPDVVTSDGKSVGAERGRLAHHPPALAQHAAHAFGAMTSASCRQYFSRDRRRLLHRRRRSLGRRRLLPRRRPHRRRAQRVGPSHRNRRNRERPGLAHIGRRSRRGRQARRPQGSGAGRLRHSQARVHSRRRARQGPRRHVGQEIGKFAAPDDIRFAESLPKTRSGKIMRRLLKDIAAGRETKGDVSTLEDLNVLAALRKAEE